MRQDSILCHQCNKDLRNMTHLPHSMCLGSIPSRLRNSRAVGFHNKLHLSYNKICRHMSALCKGSSLVVSHRINRDIGRNNLPTHRPPPRHWKTACQNIPDRWYVALTLESPGQQVPSPHWPLNKLTQPFILRGTKMLLHICYNSGSSSILRLDTVRLDNGISSVTVFYPQTHTIARSTRKLLSYV